MSLNPDFLLRFASIALINVALSGDNVIVIGMAAASLPRDQRRFAIIGGGLMAIALRIGLTMVSAMLLRIPVLSAIGGVALLWVAWNLLKAGAGGPAQLAMTPGDLRRAIHLIVVADITMSLDNIIAVAGTANGDVSLLVASLLITMPMLMVTGGAVAMLIDRFRWLVYLGAGAICFTGSRLVFDGELVRSTLAPEPPVVAFMCMLLALVIPVMFNWRAKRQRSTS
jgi:YjbE family integral membrane protein